MNQNTHFSHQFVLFYQTVQVSQSSKEFKDLFHHKKLQIYGEICKKTKKSFENLRNSDYKKENECCLRRQVFYFMIFILHIFVFF